MLSTVGDLYYRNFTHRNFRRAEECDRLIEWLGAREGDHILDVGCGDGFFDWRIARSVAGCRITGIDIHAPRLATAERKNKLPNIEYLPMDAEEMPLAPASFDKAISFCVIEHFHDDEKVLANIARSLKSGGLFVFSADSLSNPEVREEEREAHRSRYAVTTFYSAATVREKLDRHGFEVLETRYILTTPVSLFLSRLAWKLDDHEHHLKPLTELGYFFIDTIGKGAALVAERLARRSDSGLTVLCRARKR